MSTDIPTPTALARQHWNEERVELAAAEPWWPMPSWSRAPAWRRRPYLLAAEHGERPLREWEPEA